jgi:nucleotide-binding universal stress UspA family protein
MGKVGNARFKEKLFGSKTAMIIGNCSKPVLAIPLMSEWGTGSDILLAINDFKIEDKTLEPVILLARLLNFTIQVAIFSDTDDDYVEDYEEHEKKIAAFRDALKKKYPDLEIHAVHLASRHLKDSLLNWIDENKINMLVMLTHKRNIIESIFNRSLTKKMSYHTNIPLLAIPV